MTFPLNPNDRSPKGDHNRRLSLGMGPEAFSRIANITADELREYESTGQDGAFDPAVAERVGAALETMEAVKSPKVDNGPKPQERASILGQDTERQFDDVTVQADRDIDDTTQHPNPSPMNPAFP